MIQVFVTGGTFDKEYNYLSGELFFRDTHLKKMFERGRCTLDLDIKTLMMIDSVEMTEADRQIIAHNCKRTKSNQIIITHGTDRMVATAQYLAKNTDLAEKTIILTGAMVPYAFGSSSDGFFNLGTALTMAQLLSPGVYIAMNGRCFNWDKTRKNTKTGFFEEIESTIS